MSSKIPPAIQSKIERWLEHQCLSPKGWEVQPVLGSGQSIAQIWRLAPIAKEHDDYTIAERREPSGESPEDSANDKSRSNIGLGFAIRNWGRSTRDRKTIQQILFFQKAAHIGLLESTLEGISLFGDFRQASIVPDVMAWPDQTWSIEYASSIWTIETWRPGIPLERGQIVSESLLLQAFDVLDRLHATGRKLGIQRMIAPGLVERLQRLNHWTTIDTSAWNQRIEERTQCISTIIEGDYWKDILGRTLDRLHSQKASIRSGFERMLGSPVDCHWIVRDLWRENILVDRERISGIIDFGAARIDWPVLEIVRWFSSWLEPDDPGIPNLLNLLDERKLLSEDDYGFLDRTASLLSLLQWLHWLLYENISFEGREHRVRARVLELDRRLSKCSK